MKKQLNYEWLWFHIREASAELDDLLQMIEFSMKLPSGVSEGRLNRRKGRKLEEGWLKASLEHAYHHINFAWNTRTMEPEQADAQFVRHEKFPRAFVRFWPRQRRGKK